MPTLADQLTWLAGRMGETIDQTISAIPKNMWQENHITASWLSAVWELLESTELRGYDGYRSIQCALFSQRGGQEVRFGDVGVVVSIQDGDEEPLLGAGFLEAKCRHWQKNSFPALREKQLLTIYKNAPRSLMMLYDRERFFGAATERDTDFWPWYDRRVEVATHAGVVPMDLMLTAPRATRAVYRFSLPLAYQIAFRYFQGFDLHFNEEAIKAAQGWGKKEEAPTFVLVARITTARSIEAAIPEVNQELFERLATEE
jgi:hypothetical protein